MSYSIGYTTLPDFTNQNTIGWLSNPTQAITPHPTSLGNGSRTYLGGFQFNSPGIFLITLSGNARTTGPNLPGTAGTRDLYNVQVALNSYTGTDIFTQNFNGGTIIPYQGFTDPNYVEMGVDITLSAIIQIPTANYILQVYYVGNLTNNLGILRPTTNTNGSLMLFAILNACRLA
jgi:hypothetical protein